MGLGTRGSWALLFVGALLVLALLKVAVEGGDSAGKRLRGAPGRVCRGGALPSGSFQVGIWLWGKVLRVFRRTRGSRLQVTGQG